ncbi:MAG: DUF6148 family protein [Betaproteobacteria bacterium]|nr:DUF6148 family protein [Betaproteobacteria bacterium]
MAFTPTTTGVSSEADAQARLQLWLDAEQRLSVAQTASIGDRQLTRVDLPAVHQAINFWQGQVQRFRARAAGAGAGGFKVVQWSP